MDLAGITLNKSNQLFILILLAVGLNLNTLFNEYAMDDGVVLTENRFVAKGIRGIPEILTNDLMTGYTTRPNLLSQHRYRPLPLIVFALEYQFFGTNSTVSHSINLVLFVLLIALLYRLLQTLVFRKQHPYLSFLTCLLFVVHPVHTEVIANVKSRDELMAFLFLICSLLSLLSYFEIQKRSKLFIGLLWFFLALLSRESAVTFIAVVPLILYFFFNTTVKKSILFSIPLVIIFIGYMAVRFITVGLGKVVVSDFLNAPYLYATASEAFATKLFVVLRYMWLLVFPYTLSADYSYNQIPYIELSSIQFLVSALVIIVLIFYAFYAIKKKSLLSFSIFYFMVTISLVTNFAVDVGTPLSERFLFQPSLAFCIVIAFLFLKFNKGAKVIATAFLALVVILFSIKTILRNREWKNNETLFLSDVVSAPNSARTTWAATEIYRAKAEKETDTILRNKYLERAILFGERALKINPTYVAAYESLGFPYYYQGNYNKAAELWIQAYKLDPEDPAAKNCVEVLSSVMYKQGNNLLDHGKPEEAIIAYQKAIELNNSNAEAWYNLGGCRFIMNDSLNAVKAWDQVEKLAPGHRFRKEEFSN